VKNQHDLRKIKKNSNQSAAERRKKTKHQVEKFAKQTEPARRGPPAVGQLRSGDESKQRKKETSDRNTIQDEEDETEACWWLRSGRFLQTLQPATKQT